MGERFTVGREKGRGFMKKNVIAVICTAVIAMAIVLPAGLQGMLDPGSAVVDDVVAQDVPAATPDEPSGEPADATVPEGGADESAADAIGDQEYVSGVMLVGLQDGVSIDELNARLATLDYVTTKAVTEDDVVYGYVELGLADGVDVADAMSRIAGEDFVAAAQPNYIYHLLDDGATDDVKAAADLQAGTVEGGLTAQSTSVNDPLAANQWALDAIHAYDAWDKAKVEGSVTVAVLDSGIASGHEDLTGRIVAPKNFVDSDSGDANYEDDNGHGTHVAGILAATTNNGKGVAGVTYNANIMPVRVVDAKGDTTSQTLARGLRYVSENASANNVRVVNISIGTTENKSASDYDRTLSSAILEAHNKGLLLVYAAGNGGASGAYNALPCDFDTNEGAIGVISAKKSGNDYVRSAMSNYNIASSDQRTKELSAPGDNILSTAITGDKSINYYKDSKLYGYKDGTSMATPYVSGVAALVFAANPDLTAAEVRNILCETAQDMNASANISATSTFDYETGYGLIDADAAVRAATGGGGESGTIVSVAVTGSPTYTGSEVKPALTVTDAKGNTALKLGEDYTATFSNNVNVGTATVTVTGMGNYDGSATTTFSIKAASIANANVTKVVGKTYTGSAITQSPVLIFNGKTLVEGIDYSLSYSNNVNAGNQTASMIVTGKGNFTNKTSVPFTIVRAPLQSVTVSPTSYAYDGTAKTPAVTVVGSTGKTLVKDTDYTVAYSNNVNPGTATATATGKGNYVGQVSGTFSISGASIASVSVSPTSYTYDGTAKTPAVTVKDSSGKTLTQGTDYTVAYSNNVNPGTATATATGKGNYSGALTAKFTITNTATAPAVTGATQLPVGATTTFAISDGGSMRIKTGSAFATLSGNTLTGKATGTVVLSVCDKWGFERSTKSVSVYALSGPYVIHSAINSSKVLDISGGSLVNGGNLQIYQANGTAAQVFSFEQLSDGCFRIISTRCGKVLDVSGGSKSNSANVQQYAWNETNAQRWKISVDASNRLTFTNKGSGKVLDVSGAKNANGANVQQYESNNTNAQKWTLTASSYAPGPVLDGVYRLTTAVNTSYALDVSGASQSNGANVQIYKANGTNAQKWRLEYQGSGYYKLLCVASGKALDVSGASKANGANVQQYAWNGTGAQLWKIEKNSDGTYTLTCKASGKVLDVAGGSAYNGNNVWQYQSNSTKAQKWVLYQY